MSRLSCPSRLEHLHSLPGTQLNVWKLCQIAKRWRHVEGLETIPNPLPRFDLWKHQFSLWSPLAFQDLQFSRNAKSFFSFHATPKSLFCFCMDAPFFLQFGFSWRCSSRFSSLGDYKFSDSLCVVFVTFGGDSRVSTATGNQLNV